MLRRMTHFLCLLGSVRGSANEILVLVLDPEMGRVIGEIGQRRYHRRRRLPGGAVGGAQPFEDGAVEVGDHRKHQVRRRGLPMTRQQRNLALMLECNQHLRNAQHRSAAQRKPAFEQSIVEVLETHADTVLDEVNRSQQVAQVHQVGIPCAALPICRGYQRHRGCPVTAAGVEEDHIDPTSRLLRGWRGHDAARSAP